MKSMMKLSLCLLPFVYACQVEQEAPVIPVAENQTGTKDLIVDKGTVPGPKENSGELAPDKMNGKDPTDTQNMPKPDSTSPDSKPPETSVPTPTPVPEAPKCTEKELMTSAKALTPSFTLNGSALAFEYEVSALCQGIANAIPNGKILFDIDLSMDAKAANFEVYDGSGKSLSKGPISFVQDSDINGPKQGYYIWSSSSVTFAEPQTKIKFVVRVTDYTLGNNTAKTVDSYLKLGNTSPAKIPLTKN